METVKPAAGAYQRWGPHTLRVFCAVHIIRNDLMAGEVVGTERTSSLHLGGDNTLKGSQVVEIKSHP